MIGGRRVFGLAGWSGAGKTTLIERLLPIFAARGLKVATLKHAHHDFDLDQPGKDSWRHRRAGAVEVVVASARRWAIVHELGGDEPEPGLDELLAKISPVDLVIVEGFKRDPIPKLEVYRPELGKPVMAPDDPHIVGVVCKNPVEGLGLPRFDPGELAKIAAFVLDYRP